MPSRTHCVVSCRSGKVNTGGAHFPLNAPVSAAGLEEARRAPRSLEAHCSISLALMVREAGDEGANGHVPFPTRLQFARIVCGNCISSSFLRSTPNAIIQPQCHFGRQGGVCRSGNSTKPVSRHQTPSRSRSSFHRQVARDHMASVH